MTDDLRPRGADPDPLTPGELDPLLEAAFERGGSVLASLAPRLGDRGRVLLRDDDADGEAPIVDPRVAATAGLPQGRGNYQLMGEIARGGMGVVLKGHDADLGRDVALKVLHEDLAHDPTILARFVEEAQIGGQLQHPGIVPVYELGLMADERPFFTMKLVKGRTFSQLLADREDPGQDLHRHLSIFQDVCQTLAYAHSRGVIHRDLKPSNVMVGAFGEVQVVDWGLAKVLRRGRGSGEAPSQRPAEVSVIETVRSGSDSGMGSDSIAGSVMGTPAYMSPEQAGGEVEALDARTDVFALGAILCEILTGKPPYPGPKPFALAQARTGKQDDVGARLSTCGADTELVALARECLAPEAGGRPRDAGSLVARVGAYLGSVEERAQQSRVQAATAQVKVLEERRRRRLTVALAATTVALLVVGGWVGYSRSSERMETRRLVELELAKADPDRGLEEARRAVDRARAHVGSGAATADLEARVEEAAAAVAVAERERDFRVDLEAVRRELGDGSAFYKARQYEETFTRHGIPVEELSEAQILMAVRESGLAELVAPALDDWARLSRDLSRRELSRKLLQAAIRVDPDELRNRLRTAILFEDLGELVALADSAEAEGLPPVLSIVLSRELLRLGDLDRYLSVVLDARRRHPGDFHLNIKAWETLGRHGRHEEAFAFAVASGALEPASAFPLIAQGDSLLGMGREEAAEEHLQAAVDLDPDDPYTIARAAVTRLRRGKPGPAIDHLRRAIELDPGYVYAHAELAGALHEVGLEAESIAICRRTLEIDRDHVAIMNRLAWLYATAADPALRDPEQALELAAGILQRRPTANSWNTLGVARYRGGDWDGCLEALARSEERGNAGSEAWDWLFMAMAHHQLDYPERARALYDDAVAWIASQTNLSDRDNEELERFRAEAAELLGIEEDEDE